MVSPWWRGESSPDDAFAVLTRLTAGAAATVSIFSVDGSLIGPTSPWMSVPVAVAVSSTSPLSTSAWVTVYRVSAVQISESPGARPGSAGTGQVTGPSVGSATSTEARVTLPVLVTTYV